MSRAFFSVFGDGRYHGIVIISIFSGCEDQNSTFIAPASCAVLIYAVSDRRLAAGAREEGDQGLYQKKQMGQAQRLQGHYAHSGYEGR